MEDELFIFEKDTFIDDVSELEKQVERLFIIENSLADNRKEHREFAQTIDLDFEIIEDVYKYYRPACIINIYTFSERLIKSYVYTLLGNNNSPAVETFIEKKIPKSKFSPNVKSSEIQKIINEFSPNKNKFILIASLLNKEDIKKDFDYIIQSRHTYAHRGRYRNDYTKEQYLDIIRFLYYLIDEVDFCLTNMEKRIALQNFITNILKSKSDILSAAQEQPKIYIIKKLKEIKVKAQKAVCILDSINFTSYIFSDLLTSLNLLLHIDLRKNKDFIINQIEQIKL